MGAEEILEDLRQNEGLFPFHWLSSYQPKGERDKQRILELKSNPKKTFEGDLGSDCDCKFPLVTIAFNLNANSGIAFLKCHSIAHSIAVLVPVTVSGLNPPPRTPSSPILFRIIIYIMTPSCFGGERCSRRIPLNHSKIWPKEFVFRNILGFNDAFYWSEERGGCN